MPLPKVITKASVGTLKDWKNKNSNIQKPSMIIPSLFCVNEDGEVFLITSKGWRDYLLGKTEIKPFSYNLKI